MTAGRPDEFRVFAHLTAEKSAIYRAVMELFVEAKERFALHLRPQEIARSLATDGLQVESEQGALDSALHQLCDWGNLEAHPDTADVATIEEFYRPRYLYQLTPQGEAAERAIAEFRRALSQPGELRTAALAEIRNLLGELAVLGREDSPDEGKVRWTLESLRACLDELTSRAQTFLAGLQRRIRLHLLDVEAFLDYKQRLVDYLERFIGELVRATAEIAERIVELEQLGIDRLLDMAARRDALDALDDAEAVRFEALLSWQRRWRGLRDWFLGRPDRPSQAEVLRARARSSIPALLSAVAGIHERRGGRTDRVTDLRTLAAWFAEAADDASAHRLWRAAFGLAPARHLLIDQETLDEREAQPVGARTSWTEAPPMRISPRLRETGRHTRRGRPPVVIDRSDQKELLRRLSREEALEIALAQEALATGRRMRLSDFGELDAARFQVLLDLLGGALAKKVRPGDVVEAESSDGALRIVLEPAPGSAEAAILTPDGTIRGPDHFVTIRSSFDLSPAAEPEGGPT